jgi:hypothetical protein
MSRHTLFCGAAALLAVLALDCSDPTPERTADVTPEPGTADTGSPTASPDGAANRGADADAAQADAVSADAKRAALLAPLEDTRPAGSADAPPPEWVVLLEGTSLVGWRQLGDANWRVADGAIQADAGSGFLISEASYEDFLLKVEFWADETANSGVFLRCADPSEITAKNCYEVNIFDRRPDQTYRTGGIVDVAPPGSIVDTANRWTELSIEVRGTHLGVALNGDLMVDTADERLARGPVALQYGAGTIKFRNLRIRQL